MLGQWLRAEFEALEERANLVGRYNRRFAAFGHSTPFPQPIGGCWEPMNHGSGIKEFPFVDLEIAAIPFELAPSKDSADTPVGPKARSQATG